MVSFSPFFDESVRHSDIVLPDHTYLERWQDATAPSTVAYPIWSVVQPVVEPLQDTVATGDVILKLAERLGGEVASACHWPSERKMVEQRGLTLAAAKRGSAFVPSFERQELRELEQRGWWLPHRRSNAKYWASIRDAGGWFDPMFDYHDRSAISQRPDGRVWVFPAEARRQLEESDLGLIAGFLPGTEQAPSELQRGYPLTMIPFRVMTLASGSTALMPWLLENLGMLVGDAWGAWVEINPETARVHGIDHGQSILVESAEGSFEARARLFAGAQPGVVNVPYGLHTHVSGWGEAKLANPLAAVGGAVDPVSGLPDWYSTSVRVKPA